MGSQRRRRPARAHDASPAFPCLSLPCLQGGLLTAEIKWNFTSACYAGFFVPGGMMLG